MPEPRHQATLAHYDAGVRGYPLLAMCTPHVSMLATPKPDSDSRWGTDEIPISSGKARSNLSR